MVECLPYGSKRDHKEVIMGFTTPCFIRKNTQELRKKLIELGYKSSRVIDDNDHYFVEPKGRFFFWGIEYQNATIISGNFRKATVDELIEYFKTKEEQ